MDKATTLLLELLKKELWGTEVPLKLTCEELVAVMRLAQEHTVTALAARPVIEKEAVLSTSDKSDILRKEKALSLLAEAVTTHRLQYLRFQVLLCKFAALMDSGKIPYFVFKGVPVAVHYPHPHLRTMGDVDFYVPPADFHRANDFIRKNLGVDIEEDHTDKHYAFTWQGIRFEMHFQVETFGRQKHQRLFNGWMDKCAADGFTGCDLLGQSVRTLPPEKELIVVFKHLFNHLLVEGVGLRQVVDFAVLLYSYRSTVDIAALRRDLSLIGYLKAFDAFVAIAVNYLGLPGGDRYAPLSTRSRQWGDQLFDTVISSGNFGRKAHRHSIGNWKKSLETAGLAFRHCMTFAPLFMPDAPMFIFRRIGISLRKNIK